jgi:CRISPR-associated protein Cas1
MKHLVIDQHDVVLSVERACLLIRHADWRRPESVPLHQLDTLILQARLSIDSAALCKLAEHGVRVQVVPSRGQGAACYLTGTFHKDARRRLNHYALALDEALTLQWAKRVVRLRLRSQHLMLLKAAEIRRELAPSLVVAAQHIKGISQRLDQRPNVDALRGSEGAATAAYFSAYQQLFASSLDFTDRNRRPPRDPVNVALSLSYTLLHSVFAQAVQGAGLDPQIGALHSIAYGRDSLVCDLVELKRADIEWWVWRLFAEGILRVEDFSMSEAQGHLPCTLGKAGRARFYSAFALIHQNLIQDARRAVWVLAKRLHPQLPIELTPQMDDLEDEWT